MAKKSIEKINKAELIALVTQRSTLSKTQVTEIYELIVDEMGRGLAEGKPVGLSNFGVLRPVVRKALTGTSPSTGERITIHESHTVSFKPSPNLRKRLKATAHASPAAPKRAPGIKAPAKRPPAGSDPAIEKVQAKQARDDKRSGA